MNDSQLVARQITGEYRVKKADLKPLHAQALARLRGFERWQVRSVPREQNELADELVNEAIDAGRAGDRADDGACIESRRSPKLPASGAVAGSGPDSTEWHGTIRLTPAACSSAGAPARRRCAIAGSRRPRAGSAGASTPCSPAGILVVETLLCATLWGPQPAAWLWLGSQLYHETDSIGLAILVAFVGMLTTILGTLAIAMRLDRLWKIVRRASGHEQEKGALEAIFVISMAVAGDRVRDLVPRARGPVLEHRTAADGPARLLQAVRRHRRVRVQRGPARAPRAREGARAGARADARPVADRVAGAAQRRGRGRLRLPGARAPERLPRSRGRPGAARAGRAPQHPLQPDRVRQRLRGADQERRVRAGLRGRRGRGAAPVAAALRARSCRAPAPASCSPACRAACSTRRRCWRPSGRARAW